MTKLTDQLSQRLVTEEGWLFLTDCDQAPPFAEEDISDQGKARQKRNKLIKRMTRLETIHRDILSAPTCMDLSLELDFCRRLMDIDVAELAKNWRLVCLALLASGWVAMYLYAGQLLRTTNRINRGITRSMSTKKHASHGQ